MNRGWFEIIFSYVGRVVTLSLITAVFVSDLKFTYHVMLRFKFVYYFQFFKDDLLPICEHFGKLFFSQIFSHNH